MRTCTNCKLHAQPCPIFVRVADLVTSTFHCSNWELLPYNTILIDLGQRLPDYEKNNLVALSYKELDMLDEKIPKELVQTSITVIAHIDQFIRLIYLPTLRKHCYITKKGIL